MLPEHLDKRLAFQNQIGACILHRGVQHSMPKPLADRRENCKTLVMAMLAETAVPVLWLGIDDLVLCAFLKVISDPNMDRSRCGPAESR